MNLKMVRGDSKAVQFTVTQLPHAGLAGFEMWFTAKNDISDLDAAAVFQKVTGDFTVTVVGSDTVPGVCVCTIQPADTASLPDYQVVLQFDFQLENPSGDIFTAASGTLTVTPDVTRAAT